MSELRRQRSVAGSVASDSDGNRDSSAANATSPSSRASGAPRQKWIPWPKATCPPASAAHGYAAVHADLSTQNLALT
jgi:hypothetical protein